MHELFNVLKANGYLKASLGEYTTFKGYTLDNLKTIFKVSDADIGLNGKFQVYMIDPVIDQIIGRYASSPEEFWHHRDAMHWYHYLGLPLHRYDDILGMAMESDERVVVEHILARMKKKNGEWCLYLLDSNSADRIAAHVLRRLISETELPVNETGPGGGVSFFDAAGTCLSDDQ